MLSKHFDIVSAWVTFSFADFLFYFITIFYYYFFLAKILSMSGSDDPIWLSDPWSDPMIRSDDPIRDPIHVLSTYFLVMNSKRCSNFWKLLFAAIFLLNNVIKAMLSKNVGWFL